MTGPDDHPSTHDATAEDGPTSRTDEAPTEPPRWLSPGVAGVGAASFFSDSGHEITTAVLPSFLTSTRRRSRALARRRPGGLARLPNVDVSRAAGNQSEGAVAIDPTNPLRLFVVSNIASGNGLFAAHSTDSGATWTGGTIATGSGGGLPAACCDPSVSWDSFGTCSWPTWTRTPATAPSMWRCPPTAGKPSALSPTWTRAVWISPTITTGAGSVWATWTNGSDQIRAAGARVTGFGASHVGSFSGIEHAGNGDFGDIAISPTGAVMVTYPAAEQPDRRLRSGAGVGPLRWPAQRPALFRLHRPPVDQQHGHQHLVRFSDDSGAHWSSSVRVNDDTGTNSQFLPRVTLDRTSGRIAVSFYDARNSSNNTTAQIFAATSTDGTAFAANQQISAGTSNAAAANNNIDYGDYSGLAYQEGSFYPFWADNSNSTNDNPDGAGHAFDMYTATVVVSQRPTSLVCTGPTSFTAGQPATLSATLTDATSGSPLPGQTVTLTLGTQSCTATTNANGSAACTITVAPSSGGASAGGSFAGTAQYAPSSTSTPVQPTPTTLTYTGPTNADFHDAFTASATLTAAGRGIAGEAVSLADVVIASATSDAHNCN